MAEQFKVGDKVKIKGNPDYYDIKRWPREFIINHIRSTGSGFCYHPKDQSQGVFERDLEVVEKPNSEQEKLKVGDKVRVSVPRNSDAWKFDGKVGKIESITRSIYPYKVCFEGNEDDNEFKSTELEKVEG